MTSKLISSAAIRKPAKDENTTLKANLALVSSKKSEKIDFRGLLIVLCSCKLVAINMSTQN